MIKMDGKQVTKLVLKGADGTTLEKTLTEEGTIPTPTRTLNITANGTYDIANYKSVVVNISGGDTPTKTLQNITAIYSGGEVAEGTSLDSLKTNIAVTAHYSDGSADSVSDYNLTGTIAVGSNTITVEYSGKTTTITVSGKDISDLYGNYTFYDYLERDALFDAGEKDNDIIIVDDNKLAYKNIEFSFQAIQKGYTNDGSPLIGYRPSTYGGVQSDAKTGSFAIFFQPSAKKIGYWALGNDTATNIVVDDPYVKHDIKYVYGDNADTTKLIVDNIPYSIGNYSVEGVVSQDAKAPFAIFGYNSETPPGQSTTRFKCRIGKIKVTNPVSGSLTYNLTPAKNESGIYGYLDTVSGRFYHAINQTLYSGGQW